MKKSLLFTCIFAVTYCSTQAVDFRGYYLQINVAEESFVAGESAKSLRQYDAVFNE